MAKVPNDEPKKPYSPPVLTIHGTVRELTQSKSPDGSPDGGSPLNFQTAVP